MKFPVRSWWNLVPFALAGLAILTACRAQENSQQRKVQAVEEFEQWRVSRIPIWMNDFGELQRYAAADAAVGAPKPGERRVIFFGDSITDNWPIERSFPGKGYLNRGIGGQTTPQMLIRFRQDVIDLHPAVVVILAGTNDIAGNTGPMTTGTIEANYATMAELARVHGIQTVFASVTPVHDYTPRSTGLFAARSPKKILELNAWLRDYCASNGLVYLDYFGAMVDPQGLLRREFADDGLHPNPAGYAVMAPLAQAAIDKALALPLLR